MADPIRVSGPVTGTDKTLSFETGKLAQQSQGAVVASLGRTTVLATGLGIATLGAGALVGTSAMAAPAPVAAVEQLAAAGTAGETPGVSMKTASLRWLVFVTVFSTVVGGLGSSALAQTPVASPVATPVGSPEPVAGLQIPDLDLTVDPGDDFYQFANGSWRASHPIGRVPSHNPIT